MAWRETIVSLAQRLTVIAVALALAVSTVKASPAAPSCDCGMKGACCVKSAPQKSPCNKTPAQHRDCPDGCKAMCCNVVVALPANLPSQIAGAIPTANLHELHVGIRSAPAVDVILPPPRA